MKRLAAFAVLVAALLARGEAGSPLAMCAALEARMAAGDGATLPDANAELVRHAGTVDLSRGDWPEAFVARAGETVCVAVSPFTGCYEFFDESGQCFYTLVPVLATTENWVAPFRHAEEGPFPDDDLYAPWRLVDVWLLSTTEHTEDTEGGASSPSEPQRLETHAENAENAESLVTRGADGPATNLCFTSFSYTETNLFFTAVWPTNETLPESVLDLYGSTNLSSRWTLLSSHPATTNPVSFAVVRATLPWYVEPTQHVHDASCVSLTNVVLSPLDGVTVYTNAFWSCSTNRTPGECGFFRLGTRFDGDADGLADAFELLVLGSSTNAVDTDLDGLSDGEELALGTDALDPDTDGDGLPDGTEVALGLHPGLADTDRDGLPDAWELAAGLDPLDRTGDDGGSGDPDGDGLSNAGERSAGTDPFLADTDGDGVPDGFTLNEWRFHNLQASYRGETNLVVLATASVPTNASACLRIGTLSLPLSDGENLFCLRLQTGTRYPFALRCTRGATASAAIVPPEDPEPARMLSPPRSNLPGFELVDPDGGFSGASRSRADGTMAAPSIDLVSRDGLGACVHETPGTRSWNVSVSPGNWSYWSSRAEIEGFSVSGTVVSLPVADEPRSVTNGTIRVASTVPGFPPAEVSRSIHRCEYDPATGACPLCGESHDTTGVSITVTQDYRYALFGTDCMSRFAATAHGGNADDVVWTVSPELANGVWLHASDDPESVGEGEIAGAAQVWADSGFCTNQFTITASFPFAADKSVSKTFTTVAIDAEAICAETDTSGFVVNPISVPVGETATFRVKVFPASVPNNDVQWTVSFGSANATVVGSGRGRETSLQGVDNGNVYLDTWLNGCNGPSPQFQTTVMPMEEVPVVVWIVRDDAGFNPVTTETHVTNLIHQANKILKQICVSCCVDRVLYTNQTEWVDLGSRFDPDFSRKINEIVSPTNPVDGIELHFVGSMDNADGTWRNGGIVIHSSSTAEDFVHEIGHGLGLEDVYDRFSSETPLFVSGNVKHDWEPMDWNGVPSRGFYPEADEFPQIQLIRRLMMFGYSVPGRKDFSWGNVHGLNRTGGSTFELSNASVGVFPGLTPPHPAND